MYHLKEDMRAEKSAELLYEALICCMEKKEFDKITISELSKKSTVSRATFYRNFDDVIDILYWKCDRLFQSVLTAFVVSEPDLSRADMLISYVFSFWMKHTDILEILIERGRVDIIYNSFLKNAGVVMEYLSDKLHLPEWNTRYFISTRVGIFVGVFQAWITGGKRESVEELTHILNQQVVTVRNTNFIF